MMTGVRLGGESAFTLRNAILVYGDGKQSFATVHDPIEGPKKGAPLLGAARPLGAAFLKTLATELGESLPAEVLPAPLLVRTPAVTVWWRAASVAPCFYGVDTRNAAERKAFKALSGRPVPHPPLVFLATANALAVRALAKNERPSAETKLFSAPYYNVGREGAVCVGTMRRPADRSLDALAVWEDSFFRSEFTHPLPGAGQLRKGSGSFLHFWTKLADQTAKAKRSRSRVQFPTRALVPCAKGQTLAAFVQSELGRSW